MTVIRERKTEATCYITIMIPFTMDVEELVAEFGPKARTKSFLTDYAVGNYGCDLGPNQRSGSGIVLDTDLWIEEETIEKRATVVK